MRAEMEEGPSRGRGGAAHMPRRFKAPFSTRWAHCERVVGGREHGDHQVEGAASAVEGGVLEEQRGEGRLARHQPPLVLAPTQPLIGQRAADAIAAVAQRARRDNNVHGRLTTRDGPGRRPATAHRLAVAGHLHVQLGQRPLLVPHPAGSLGPEEKR